MKLYVEMFRLNKIICYGHINYDSVVEQSVSRTLCVLCALPCFTLWYVLKSVNMKTATQRDKKKREYWMWGRERSTNVCWYVVCLVPIWCFVFECLKYIYVLCEMWLHVKVIAFHSTFPFPKHSSIYWKYCYPSHWAGMDRRRSQCGFTYNSKLFYHFIGTHVSLHPFRSEFNFEDSKDHISQCIVNTSFGNRTCSNGMRNRGYAVNYYLQIDVTYE